MCTACARAYESTHFIVLGITDDTMIYHDTKYYDTIVSSRSRYFLADRTNGRDIGTVLRLSVAVVCL